ncbi:mandelate racemase/muconate lactonizing enzyme family protein [Paenibacillus septentrionalis]|uniref:Dipeptide epimerase n=1 Tax=Paenibacillus septentrionalis TaxID=429342 RepID=A0ABW1V733_9BACL
MNITSVDIYRYDLPLSPPFTHASSGTVTHLKEVYVKLSTNTGIVGWSEVRGNCEYVTGDTPERVVAVLQHIVAPYLLGKDPLQRNAINRDLDRLILGNSAAKAAIDIALLDLAGRHYETPAAQLLGGIVQSSFASDATIAFGTVEQAKQEASNYLQAGFRVLKVRVGPDRALDLKRVTAAKEVIEQFGLSQDVLFCVDANQGWSVKEAALRIAQYKPLGVEWIEQPVPADHIAGLKTLKHMSSIPIVADESCKSVADVARIAAEDAADIVHLKIVKAGSIAKLQQMMGIADAFHLPVMLGQMDEGRLATAALLHAAAASSAKHFEVWGFQRVKAEDDPVSALVVENGRVHLPAGPGLGVEVDEHRLCNVASLS